MSFELFGVDQPSRVVLSVGKETPVAFFGRNDFSKLGPCAPEDFAKYVSRCHLRVTLDEDMAGVLVERTAVTKESLVNQISILRNDKSQEFLEGGKKVRVCPGDTIDLFPKHPHNAGWSKIQLRKVAPVVQAPEKRPAETALEQQSCKRQSVRPGNVEETAAWVGGILDETPFREVAMQAVRDEMIDEDTIADLTEADVKELFKVTAFGPRKKLVKAIAGLQSAPASSQPVAPATPATPVAPGGAASQSTPMHGHHGADILNTPSCKTVDAGEATLTPATAEMAPTQSLHSEVPPAQVGENAPVNTNDDIKNYDDEFKIDDGALIAMCEEVETVCKTIAGEGSASKEGSPPVVKTEKEEKLDVGADAQPEDEGRREKPRRIEWLDLLSDSDESSQMEVDQGCLVFEQEKKNCEKIAQQREQLEKQANAAMEQQAKMMASLDETTDLLNTVNALVTSKKFTTPKRAQTWCDQVADIRRLCELPDTVIGVLGETGCGKSSVINAVLGEDNVVPTNGMRACTASVLLLKYLSPDSPKPYVAEVEFLTREEWMTEVAMLFDELKDEHGVVTHKFDRPLDLKSESGVALAKLRAVYGSAVFMRGARLHDLERPNLVTRSLSTTKHLDAETPTGINRKLSQYADSSNSRDDLQHWPVVKKITIRGSWPTLATGAVLVDLPGVKDANAARSKVAETYTMCCSTLWVVAPIQRAVDNGTAKDLMGSNFRRQLLMDNKYGSISFVCTKTDDINATEIERNLGTQTVRSIDPEAWDKMDAISTELRSRYRDNHDEHVNTLDNLHDAMDTYQHIDAEYQRAVRRLKKMVSQKARDEEIVLNGGATPKPKVEAVLDDDLGVGAQTQLMTSFTQMDEDEEVIEEDEATKAQNLADARDRLLLIEDAMPEARAALLAAKAKRNEAKTVVHDLETQKSHLEQNMVSIKNQLVGPDKERASICARARNQYSKNQIREDFLNGIQELREEAFVSGEDVEDLPSNDQLHDLQQKVDVYTVSSSDFLKLTGELSKSGASGAFDDIDHTEIPDLRKRITDLTFRNREVVLKRISESVSTLYQDITVYVELCKSSADKGSMLPENLEKLQISVKDHLHEFLEKPLSEHSNNVVMHFRAAVKERMEPRLMLGASEAKSTCMNILNKFHRPYCRQDRQAGGLHHSTYMATMIRMGEYSSPSYGPIDMNSDLAEPISSSIGVEWHEIINTYLCKMLSDFPGKVDTLTTTFMSTVHEVMMGCGVDKLSADRICDHAKKSATTLTQHKTEDVSKQLQEEQRESSRVVSPAIRQQLEEHYLKAKCERGAGRFARQKAIMANAINTHAGFLYDQTVQALMKELDGLLESVRMCVSGTAEGIHEHLLSTFSTLWQGKEFSIDMSQSLGAFEYLVGKFNEWDTQMTATVREVVVPIESLVKIDEDDEDVVYDEEDSDSQMQQEGSSEGQLQGKAEDKTSAGEEDISSDHEQDEDAPSAAELEGGPSACSKDGTDAMDSEEDSDPNGSELAPPPLDPDEGQNVDSQPRGSPENVEDNNTGNASEKAEEPVEAMAGDDDASNDVDANVDKDDAPVAVGGEDDASNDVDANVDKDDAPMAVAGEDDASNDVDVNVDKNDAPVAVGGEDDASNDVDVNVNKDDAPVAVGGEDDASKDVDVNVDKDDAPVAVGGEDDASKDVDVNVDKYVDGSTALETRSEPVLPTSKDGEVEVAPAGCGVDTMKSNDEEARPQPDHGNVDIDIAGEDHPTDPKPEDSTEVFSSGNDSKLSGNESKPSVNETPVEHREGAERTRDGPASGDVVTGDANKQKQELLHGRSEPEAALRTGDVVADVASAPAPAT